MNLILVDRTSGLTSSLEKITEVYPKNSQVILTDSNFHTVMKRISVQPIYTEGWMIVAYCRRVPEDILVKIGSGKNVVIYVVRSEEDGLELALTLDLNHLLYSYLNDTVPSKEELFEYIKVNLKISDFMTNYLGNRANWRWEIIQSSVMALEGVKKITKKDICYFTPLHPSAGMDDVIEFLLGFKETKDEASIYSVVQRYSYSYKFLFEITTQKLDLIMWLYEQIEVGLLSHRNYKDFRKAKIKEIRSFGKYSGINNYRLSRVIESFGYISFERVYYYRSLCKKVYQESPSVLGFLNLMKVGVASGSN